MKKLRFKDDNGDYYPEWGKDYLGNISTIKTGNLNVADAQTDGAYYFFDRSAEIKKLNKYSFDTEAIIYPGEGSEFFPKYYSGKFGLHQRAYAILNFKQHIEPRYLYYYLKTKNNHFLRTAVGSTVKSLRMNCFKTCTVDVPVFAEQKKISDFLSVFDRLVEKQKKKVELLKGLKKGYMQQVFKRELRFKDESGNPYSEWKQTRLSRVLEIYMGKDYKHVHNPNGKYPVYGTGGIISYADDYLCDWLSVGIGRKGSIDNPVLIQPKFWTVDTLFYTKPHSGHNVVFQYYLMKSINLMKYNEASGVPSLSRRTIYSIPVKIPCLHEQEKIGRFLHALDKLLENEISKKEQYEEIKKGYMQRLFAVPEING